MALLIGILLWTLAGEQPALLAPKSAGEQPRRILTSPDPDMPAPPKTLIPPTGPTAWPAADLPPSETSKTAPATEPWPQRQPASPRQPAATLAPPADVQSGAPATSASSLVAQYFYVPSKEILPGKPVMLLEAVSRSFDRQQQLQIVRAYWRTARATADLCLCAAYKDTLEQLRVGPADALLLEAAKASAAAALSQARVEAVAAQHELASAMRLPVDAPLPLAADLPHAGNYRTYFAEIHATRLPSDTAKRANATIPLRYQAMQHQAAALAAATRLFSAMKNRPEEAAILDIPRVGQSSTAEALSELQQFFRQQRSFAEAVMLYNLDIAEYALSVAGPEVTPQVLVNMLIRSRTTGPAAMDAPRLPVQPAQYQQDLESPGNESPGNLEAIPPGVAQPSGAAGKSLWPASKPEELSNPLLPLRAFGKSLPGGSGDSQEAPTPHQSEATPLHNSVGSQTTPSAAGRLGPVTGPLVPVEPAAHFQPAPAETTLRRPLLPLAPMLYSALHTAAPSGRAKQLASSLHSDWALPDRTCQPLPLRSALSAAPAGQRRAVIEAYWLARQKAAEYQVLLQQVQWLEEYADRAADGTLSAGQRLTAFNAQRLTAFKEDAQANLRRSHAELVQAQYRLAAVVSISTAHALPWPTTLPHAGGYQLRLESQPLELTRSRTVQRLAALVPALAETVRNKADSVVAADAARAKMAESFRSGSGSLSELLSLTSQQMAETLDFLRTLTAYNLAIADYALAVMPAEVPSHTLAAALVAEP